MNRQLGKWVEENKDNVSFCPLCRTRIEKNKGCNHMTCGFCKYEFCWACGASATNEENHFGAFRGCGVKMMDENVKPGDHLKLNRCSTRAWCVAKVILCIIFYPVIVVFWCPCSAAQSSWRGSQHKPTCERVAGTACAFCFGLVLDVVVVPMLLLMTVAFLLYWIIRILFYLICCCWVKDLRACCARCRGG